MPSHNWRDAFEDLLAMDLAGGMISDGGRKAEDAYAAQDRYDRASEHTAVCNHVIKQSLDLEAKLSKMKGATVECDNGAMINIDDSVLAAFKSDREVIVSEARGAQAEFEKHRNSSASSMKPRGQWMASLMTSGALPGWSSDTKISIAGIVMGFRRRDAPPDLDAGIQISELELQQIFEEGKTHNLSTYGDLPSDQLRALGDGSLVVREESDFQISTSFTQFAPGPTSILIQTTDTEPVPLAGGFVGVRTTIRNQLVNGTWVTKEFVREPADLLEEVENGRKSMRVLSAVLTAPSQPGKLSQMGDVIDPGMAEHEDDPLA